MTSPMPLSSAGTTYHARHLAMPMIIGGAVLTAVAVAVSIASTPIGGVGTVGVVLLIMGWWKQTGDYVSLYADHLTTKAGPAASRKAMLYSEIIVATRKGPRLTIDYRPHIDPPSSKPRRLHLRINEMVPDQREPFMRQLLGKLPTAAFKQA